MGKKLIFTRNIKIFTCPAAGGTRKYERTSAIFEPCLIRVQTVFKNYQQTTLFLYTVNPLYNDSVGPPIILFDVRLNFCCNEFNFKLKLTVVLLCKYLRRCKEICCIKSVIVKRVDCTTLLPNFYPIKFFIRVEKGVDPDQMVIHQKPADLYLQFFLRINQGSVGHGLGVNFEVNKR